MCCRGGIIKAHISGILTVVGLIGFVLTAFFGDGLNEDFRIILVLFFIFLFIEAYMRGLRSTALSKDDPLHTVNYQAAPLDNKFAATSIIGFMISAFYIMPNLSESFGFAFTLVFLFMFIASMISMTNAPVGRTEEEQKKLAELAVHHKIHGKKKFAMK